MENIKIWHAPDEKPKVDDIVVAYDKGIGEYIGVFDGEDINDKIHGMILRWKDVRQWAHLDVFVDTSKALDVAIDELNNLKYASFFGDEWSIMGDVSGWCVKALKRINEIMKGREQ